MAEKCACNSIWDPLLPQEPHTKICQATVSSCAGGTVDSGEACHTDMQRMSFNALHCVFIVDKYALNSFIEVSYQILTLFILALG